jgi:excisionase family DNA binding protein
MTEPALLRIVEVARMTALSRSYVYALINEGRLPSVRIGNAVRVPRAALMEFISRNIVGLTA